MDPDAEARTQDAEEGALPAGTGALPRRSRVFTANIDAEVEEATAADVATALPARRSRRDIMQNEPLDPPEGANEPATLGALPADTLLHERRRTPPRRGRIALTEDNSAGTAHTGSPEAPRLRSAIPAGALRSRGRGRGQPTRGLAARPPARLAGRARAEHTERQEPSALVIIEDQDARSPPDTLPRGSRWSRPQTDDDWLMYEDYEEEPSISRGGPIIIPPQARAAGEHRPPAQTTSPPNQGRAQTQASPHEAPPEARAQDPQGLGLFRALRENLPAGLASIRAPTPAELHGITVEGLSILFDFRRIAEITRARGVTEDVKAAQALKAQQTLEGKGWAHTSLDVDQHGIFFGPQVVFRPGQSPYHIGQLLSWAVPFAVDVPGDVSKSQEWTALRDTAASLLPQLEAEIFHCRQGGREFNLSATIVSQGRALAEAYFKLRAKELLPLMSQLGASPLEEQAKTVIRGYVHQARTLPKTWQYVEDMIISGTFRQYGVDPALHENAARTAMLRPFLSHFLQGQTKNWDTSAMVTEYLDHRPSATLLHSTNFSNLARTVPAVAELAASFQLPSLPPALTRPPAPSPSRLALPPPPQIPAVSAATGPPAPRFAPAAGNGPLTHPMFFSGEYAIPPGWAPPPPQAASPAKPRPPAGAKLTIPTAQTIVGASSPLSISSPHACDHCQIIGHAQYECPKRYYDQFGRPLPGFTASGTPDPTAWVNGDLIPAARRDMAAYLTACGVQPHRRFGVTTGHIASGTAPPPPA